MAISTITWADKSNINTSSVPEANKITDSNMNQVKSVVNTNANLQGDLSSLNTTEKGSLVGALNETIYNLTPDGTEIKLNYKIDSKWAYAKMINFITPSTEDDYTINTNISNLYKIYKMYGMIGDITPIPFAIWFGSTSYFTSLRVNGSNVLYKGSSAYGNTSAYVVIIYTKTS